MSDSLEGSGIVHRLHMLPNMNVTLYVQNLRQYIPKNVHTLRDQNGEETDNNESEGFEYLLRKAAMKELWDNKSSKVRETVIMRKMK